MQKDSIYITVNHLDDFNTTYMFKPGDIITLKKDPDNCYDDEAIVAYDKHSCKCGYVANSVHSVARGTFSAGRVYDRIPDEEKCIIRFITEECLIGEISPLLTQNEQEEDDDGING